MAKIVSPDHAIRDYMYENISKKAYITNSKRIYMRENKKFVPIGWRVGAYNPHDGIRLPDFTVLDDQLQ